MDETYYNIENVDELPDPSPVESSDYQLNNLYDLLYSIDPINARFVNEKCEGKYIIDL